MLINTRGAHPHTTLNQITSCARRETTLDDLLEVLQGTPFGVKKVRVVTGTASPHPQSLGFGVVNRRQLGVGTSLSTRDPAFLPLIRLLCRVARELDPGLRFTSIQVNRNSKFGLHTDSTNMGESGIVAVGGASGGELWVHDPPCDNHASPCACRFRDVRRFQRFDGNKPHFTKRFSGERYTAVFYITSSFRSASAVDLEYLTSLGFALPEPDLAAALELKRKSLPPKEERIDAAMKDLIEDQGGGGARGEGASASEPIDLSDICVIEYDSDEEIEVSEVGVTGMAGGAGGPAAAPPAVTSGVV